MKTRVFAVCVVVFLFCGITHAGWSDGLVACYPFNGNANDESGNGYHGTVYGATLTADRFGNPKNAYDFDGVNDYIKINISNSSFLSEYSISCWVLFRDFNNNYSGILNGSNNYIALHGLGPGYGNDTKKVGFYQASYEGVNWIVYPVLTAYLTENVFYHVVVTRDKSNCSIYLNGKVQSSKQVNINSPVIEGGYLTIGALATLSKEDFVNGKIDDIRIYNRVLSDSEVQQLYRGVSPSVIVKPYTFTSGTPAKAAEVNADLDILYQQINVLRTIVCADHPTANGCQ
jgi:hypothetical protein